jgi:DNA-binding ferritin-like protein (Dps family)
MPEPYTTHHDKITGHIFHYLFTEHQLKQYARDALESAAVEMQGLFTYGGDDVAAVIRAMKEQIK